MNTWIVFHLSTIVPVLIIGPVILFRTKGNSTHKQLGKIWTILMLTSCLSSFGITYQGRFSWLHALSIFTVFSIVTGIIAAKNRNAKVHQRKMLGAYIGTMIAFGFAFAENRIIGSWIRDLIR